MTDPSIKAVLDRQHRKLVKTRYVYIGDAGSSGAGIFAGRAFAAGEPIVIDEDGDYYEGSLSEAEILALGLDLSTHCFQIDDDRYLLPNGSIDDLINHSCNPTAGIRLTPKGYRLIALRPIAAGQQITYDYSTYISNSREVLHCTCGEPGCRLTVGPFRDLPQHRQSYYCDLDVVGPFALKDAIRRLQARQNPAEDAAALPVG